MDERKAYALFRKLSTVHPRVKRTTAYRTQFRYHDAFSVTPDAIRQAARAALSESKLKRTLDMKSHFSATGDTETEADLLSKIETSTDDNINQSMDDLIAFYDSIGGGK